nr:hypothetical protein [uncultured Bacteroides sp.]
MKKIFIVFLLFPLCLFAQKLNYYDSLKAELRKNINDSLKLQLYITLGLEYGWTNPDSAIHYALETVKFVTSKRDKLPPWAEWNSSYVLGTALSKAGNYPDAQKYFLKQLKQSESIKDTFGIFQAYRCLGYLNQREGNYKNAIKYSKISLHFFQDKKDPWWQGNYSNMAACLAKSYEELNILDSALYYAQIGHHIDLTYFGKDASIFWGNIFGPIYSKLGQPALALEYFRLYYNNIKNYPEAIEGRIVSFYETSKHFELYNRPDSAIYYARKAFLISQTNSYKIHILNTSRLLSKLFKSTNKIDSAFKYQSIMLETEEFIFSREKISRMNILEFNEQLRQKEIEITIQKQEQERIHRIQLRILTISIIIVIIAFLLLSRSIIVNQKTIEYLGIIVLLITFEFIDQVLHPIIEKATHNSPILMLLILVSIAALLVPLHYKLEKWSIAKLVEKNKKIRLTSAKKTIEQLEGKKT